MVHQSNLEEGFGGVPLILGVFTVLLGFYDRNGFMRGVEPRNSRIYALMSLTMHVEFEGQYT